MYYILDTSVILSDPKALERLGDRHVILPLVVLTELESKRTHPELGYPARTALRYLEALRDKGSLTESITTPQGGSVKVEINHISEAGLPEVLSAPINDNRILAVAFNLKNEGHDVILMSKDLPMRLKASVAGIQAEDYSEEISKDNIGKIIRLEVEMQDIQDIYQFGSIEMDGLDDIPINTGLILSTYVGQSALAKVGSNGEVKLIRQSTPMDISSKNAGQAIALDLLTDSSIGIVSLGGLAGSGKTVMALAAGVEAVRKRKARKLVIFRPVTAVGGQELGFLPGTAEEKMAPWAAAVYDAMESFMKPNEIRDMRGLIEILPLTHIRGRTLKESFVIIDEAQNLDLMTLVTALSRLGNDSRVVLTHDVTQRDNLRVGKYDGIAKVISTLAGNPLFAHVVLEKSERSPIADLIANSFDL